MKHTYLKNTQLTINFKYLKYVKILKYYILINNLYLLKNSYKDHDEQNVNIYIYIYFYKRTCDSNASWELFHDLGVRALTALPENRLDGKLYMYIHECVVVRTDSTMSTKCQLYAIVSVFDTRNQLTWIVSSRIKSVLFYIQIF